MMITVDQLTASNKASLETARGLSAKTYAGFGKMVELNFAASKVLMSESMTLIRNLMAARNPQQVMALQGDLLAPMAEKAVSYGRHVYGIAVETSSEFTKAFEGRVAEGQKVVSQVMDSLSRNAPAGTEPAVAVLKSAMVSGQSAFESAQSAAKHVIAMAENNVAAITEQALSTAAALSPKT